MRGRREGPGRLVDGADGKSAASGWLRVAAVGRWADGARSERRGGLGERVHDRPELRVDHMFMRIGAHAVSFAVGDEPDDTGQLEETTMLIKYVRHSLDKMTDAAREKFTERIARVWRVRVVSERARTRRTSSSPRL